MDVPLLIYCADIGSVSSGNFGWCSEGPTLCTTGTSMRELAANVANDLRQGSAVALGFECPLFVPLNCQPERLTRARVGEGSRAWSAGAGTGALATGLVQVAWVLREVRRQVGNAAEAHLDWPRESSVPGLFIWEAFVSGGAKRGGHVEDAKAAVEAFAAAVREAVPGFVSAVGCDEETYSLIGAALLRTGWSTDVSLLTRACPVIRAAERAV